METLRIFVYSLFRRYKRITQLANNINTIKEGLGYPKEFIEVLDEAINGRDILCRYLGLKLVKTVAGIKGFEKEKIVKFIPLLKIIECFTPQKEIEEYGMTRDEVRLCALKIMEHIWDQGQIWGDTHTSEMNKAGPDSGLNFISRLINTPGAEGRIGAFKTLCLISKSGGLIPEFCSKDVPKSILAGLHSSDKSLRLYSAEILKNFTNFPKLTDYIDRLDLLRHMIDAFFSTEDNKIINLLLEAFLNLADNPIIRVASLNNSELFFPLSFQTKYAGFSPNASMPLKTSENVA